MKEKIAKILENEPKILAAWFGGSDATGKNDHLSDIDVVIICEDPILPFELLEKELSNIDQKWIVQDGPYIQRFYTLKNTPDTFYLDVVVFTETKKEPYQEYYNQERHGLPQMIFDRTTFLKEAALSPTKESPKLDLENEKARFEIMYRTFKKEALRKKYIDAYAFYQKEILLYTRIVRVKHCPQKHDFGLRYIYLDLPKDEASFIEELLKVTDIEAMMKNSNRMREKLL